MPPQSALAQTDNAAAVAAVSAYAPDIVAPATPASLRGTQVAPQIADLGTATGVITTDGSLTESAISAAPAAGFQFGTSWGYLSVIPTQTSSGASNATVINDAAAVFEGTAAGADTIVRPSALGVWTYTQIRSSAAPETYSWRLSLPGGQLLKRLDDGSVAILAPARPFVSAPVDAFKVAVDRAQPPTEAAPTATVPADPVPVQNGAPPPPKEQTVLEKGAADSASQLESAADTLVGAGQDTDGHLVAAIEKPWAVDANGKQVPVSLSVEGDIVTMTVKHRGGGYDLPVIADPDLIDCKGTSTYDAATTSAIPLVSGARIADTFEEPPIAHPFSYSRWIVVEGPPAGSSRDLAFRQRYQLIYDDWRDVTPPRASGTYAALSPDRQFRLVYLTTGDDALKRSKQLSMPERVRRRLGSAKRPTVVVLIDRNVTFPVGTG